MSEKCKFCESPMHGTKKRAWLCGTWKSAAGEIVRSQGCETIEAAVSIRNEALAKAAESDRLRILAETAKDEAEKCRDAAIEASKDPLAQIAAAKVRIREEFREQLKLAFDHVLETEPDHNELLDA